INLTAVDPSLWNILEPPVVHPYLGDRLAAKAWVLKQLNSPELVKDQLRAAWAERLESEAGTAVQVCLSDQTARRLQEERPFVLTSSVRSCFSNEVKNPVEAVWTYFGSFVTRNPGPVIASHDVKSELEARAPAHAALVN